jgi:hypothetical protein
MHSRRILHAPAATASVTISKRTPKSSLVHFRLAECLTQEKDRASAVNEFREALSGDLWPS